MKETNNPEKGRNGKEGTMSDEKKRELALYHCSNSQCNAQITEAQRDRYGLCSVCVQKKIEEKEQERTMER